MFLHLSSEEPRKRFRARIAKPQENRNFSSPDLAEGAQRDDKQRAHETAIRAIAAPHAPWHVVPPDHPWFSRVVVASALIVTADDVDRANPTLPPRGASEAQGRRGGPWRRRPA
ncbi:MAG: hypothetical protein RML45_08520 [Acetobacteraceae bacterium]|nr:hypothetical protein [Acetobacteraceae bacterium]